MIPKKKKKRPQSSKWSYEVAKADNPLNEKAGTGWSEINCSRSLSKKLAEWNLNSVQWTTQAKLSITPPHHLCTSRRQQVTALVSPTGETRLSSSLLASAWLNLGCSRHLRGELVMERFVSFSPLPYFCLPGKFKNNNNKQMKCKRKYRDVKSWLKGPEAVSIQPGIRMSVSWVLVPSSAPHTSFLPRQVPQDVDFVPRFWNGTQAAPLLQVFK